MLRHRLAKRPLPGVVIAIALALCCLATDTWARDPGAEPGPWTFRTRAVVSGDSQDSDPAGYVAYSGVALEAGLTRRVARLFAVEFNLHTESREIDREVASGPDVRLGSLEVLPVALTFQFRPRSGGRIHPYLGLGAAVSFTWEKSGALDSLDVETHVGPAVQLGVDYDLGSAAVLNLDLRWNTFTAKIDDDGERLAEIQIDPLTLGIGVGFHF